MVDRIFTLQLQLNNANASDTKARYLELHAPSMLPDKAKFVDCSIISLALWFWMKHLVIGQLQKPA